MRLPPEIENPEFVKSYTIFRNLELGVGEEEIDGTPTDIPYLKFAKGEQSTEDDREFSGHGRGVPGHAAGHGLGGQSQTSPGDAHGHRTQFRPVGREQGGEGQMSHGDAHGPGTQFRAVGREHAGERQHETHGAPGHGEAVGHQHGSGAHRVGPKVPPRPKQATTQEYQAAVPHGFNIKADITSMEAFNVQPGQQPFSSQTVEKHYEHSQESNMQPIGQRYIQQLMGGQTSERTETSERSSKVQTHETRTSTKDATNIDRSHRQPFVPKATEHISHTDQKHEEWHTTRGGAPGHPGRDYDASGSVPMGGLTLEYSLHGEELASPVKETTTEQHKWQKQAESRTMEQTKRTETRSSATKTQRTDGTWSDRHTQYQQDRITSDPERQKRLMEDEMQRRSEQSHQQQQYSSEQTSQRRTDQGAGGGQRTEAVIVYRGDSKTDGSEHWTDAAGANTKATTSGTYDDPEGNKVHYTKEVYTSSDPGKEFSMFTEEEKKVMEQPLQAGVLARFITTTYHKKSTYTCSTTTCTPTGPVQTTAQLPGSKTFMIEATRGQMSPGMSQF